MVRSVGSPLSGVRTLDPSRNRVTGTLSRVLEGGFTGERRNCDFRRHHVEESIGLFAHAAQQAPTVSEPDGKSPN